MPHKDNRTHIAAIMNLTPDSFSDGGELLTLEAVGQRVHHLCALGVDAIDVGAESTRPGAVLLDSAAEWERLQPFLPHILAIAHDAGVTVSVDTRHAATAAEAIALGVDMINIQDGLERAEMLEVLHDSDVRIIMMHSLGIPPRPDKIIPPHKDVVAEVTDALACMADDLRAMGIARSRLIADVGIGFGKSPAQSLALLAAAGKIQHQLGLPLYVGHSRKSFMSLISDLSAPQRDELTRAYSSLLITQGVAWVRVHDAAGHVALRNALQGHAA